MLRRRLWRLGLAGTAALLAVGLAPGALAHGASGSAASSATLSIGYPSPGAVVTTTDIPVRVVVSGFTVACDEAGAPDREGTGHIHAMLDGMSMAQLINFYCSQEFTISGKGVSPGQHTLTVDLASNTHMDMEDTAKSVTFLYQPTVAPAGLPAANPATGATVAITAPTNGATVGPHFNLVVQATSFTPSCNLEGKQNVAGYGHYHVFVDMSMGGGGQAGSMMSMAGMISMPCTNVIPVDLSAWPSGQHTLAVELEQNDHTPLMDPGAKEPKLATIELTLQNPYRP